MSDARPTYLHPRYARQHVLRELGVVGQEKLANSRVLIVGAGGLGSPAAMYLAAAGVGTIGLVDTDVVDESNLHRQLLYGMHDVGESKLTAAQRRLQDINPLVHIRLHRTRIAAANAREIISQYDIVVDGTDNFPARYAINDACVAHGIPFVYGSVARFEGQVSVFAAPEGPCYRCLFAEEPQAGTVPNCAEDGVLGILPGIVGLHQSTEVIKWLTGIGRLLVGRLLMLDLLDHSTNEVTLARDPECVVCGHRATVRNLAHSPASAAAIQSSLEADPVTLPHSTGSNAEVEAANSGTAPSARDNNATHSMPIDAVPASVAKSNTGARVTDFDSKFTPAARANTGPPSSRTMPVSAPEIDVLEVAERLRSGDALVLLDVREPWEFEIAQLPDAVLVPLSSLPSAVSELGVDREYIVYCHHGTRSAMAANWLKSRGYERVSNMTGGINAWSINVDRTVPLY